MRPIQDYYARLAVKQRIVITMHQKPDGDAMGSSLGLYHFLKRLGHEVTVISPTNWAFFLDWMPGIAEVLNYEKDQLKAEELIAEAETLFCLDFNVMYRTKNMEQPLMDANCSKILIDHHRQPQEEVFEYGLSNIYKSSTCELIYDIIVESGYASLLDKNIATCLYTGLMTDTGSFRFPSTTVSVFLAVAHLKELGIDHTAIHEHIFDSFLENRLRFLGNSLLNRMEVLYEYNTAIMVIPRSDLLKFNTQTGDTEGFVNFLLSINGINLAALVIDRSEERKWSFRSKGSFDVNEFARMHFSGGRHKNAAGGSTYDSLETTVQKFKEVLPTYKNELTNF